jgi:hypothetical protein
MALLADESIAQEAAKRETYRLTNVCAKLTRREAFELNALAEKRGVARGELIRQLILAELGKDAEAPTADPILSEIIGVRLLLVNLLKPQWNDKNPLTQDAFDAMLTEIQKVKKQLALQVQQELESR